MYYNRRTDVKVQHVDGETLVLDDKNELIHQLNQTASFVWNLCDGRTSTTQIVRSLVNQFDVDESVAAQDVPVIIEKLRELNLLCE